MLFFRSVPITVVIAAAIAVVLLALLDRLDSLPGHADADPASQPRELHSQPAMGPELLHRALWSPDSGSAVYFLARAPWFPDCVPCSSASGWHFCSDWAAPRLSVHLLLGRAFDVLTMERFSYWATLLALPFVGVLAAELVDHYRIRHVAGLSAGSGSTCGLAVGVVTIDPAERGEFGLPSRCQLAESRRPRSIPLRHPGLW